MDHKIFYKNHHHIETIVILFTFLVDGVLSFYTNSSTCAPQNCGDGLSIEYPFWILGKQESYCGSPMFNITCKNRNSVLKISDDDYIIKSIFYANNSLLLSQAELYDGANQCPTPQHNFSIERTPFSYGPETVDLFFYYNCTVPYHKETFPVNCASNSSSEHSFAVVHPGILNHWNYSVHSCGAMVNAAVTTDSIEILLNMNYTEVLRRGFALQWDNVDCSNCQRSGGRCGSYYTEFICVCSDHIHPKICDGTTGHRLNLRLKIAIAATVGGMGLVICLVIFLFKFKKSSDASKEDRDLGAFIKQHGSLAPKRYPYSDIKKMTNSLKVEVGKGGYGTVYKGRLQDGHLVAVKILNPSKGNGEDFINEVFSTVKTSHVNVARLLGFCLEGKRRALVYDYMPNGSLEKYIHSKSYNELGMDKLHQISLGIARGLEYLHRGCNTRILHFDIKPHNILLDEDFCPKISDFGLAKQCTNRDSIVSLSIPGARGTIGYIAPELISRNFGPVSYKSDVYSYGMMILEIVGRRKNVNAETSHTSEIYFPYWVYQHLIVHKDLILKGIVTPEEDEIAKKIILVGLWCIQNDPSLRPTMSKVIELLEGSLQAIEIPPKAFFGSPSISPQDSNRVLQ